MAFLAQAWDNHLHVHLQLIIESYMPHCVKITETQSDLMVHYHVETNKCTALADQNKLKLTEKLKIEEKLVLHSFRLLLDYYPPVRAGHMILLFTTFNWR